MASRPGPRSVLNPEKPKAPEELEVVEISNSLEKRCIKLKWAAVNSNNNQVDGYRLERSIAFKENWKRVHGRPELPSRTTSFTVGDSKPYEAYHFCVRSTMKKGAKLVLSDRPYEPKYVVAKEKYQPYPPRNVRVTGATEDSVTLMWLEPEPDDDYDCDDSSVPSYKYIVDICDHADDNIINTWTTYCETQELQYTVKGLKNFKTCRFRVSALNEDKNVRSLPQEMEDPEMRIHIKQKNAEPGQLERLQAHMPVKGATAKSEEIGSIIYVISCHDLSGLRELWMNYKLGNMEQFFQDLFALESSLGPDSSGRELDIEIDEQDFYDCRQHLLLTCSNAKGFRVVKTENHGACSRAFTPMGLSEDYPVYCKPLVYNTTCSQLDFLDAAILNNQGAARRSTRESSTSTTERSPGTTERSPGTTERSPGTTERSPGTTERSPGTTERSPGTTERSPGTTERSPGTTERSSGTIGRSPGTTERSHGIMEMSHGTTKRSPGTIGRLPGTTERSPGTTERSHGTTERSHGTTERSPGTIGRSPGTTGRSPGKTERSPGTTEKTPGTTGRSPGTTGRSPGTTERLPGTTEGSPGTRMTKLLELECLKAQSNQELSYGRALIEAIVNKDQFMETEVLKSLGDLHLKKGKLSKDSAEFDKAAALYAAALLRCKDPDMGQTLEHRIGYMEKLSRQLLHGYTPHFRWLLPDYWGTADSNVLRVAEICDKLDRRVGKPWHSVEEAYIETLVSSITNMDVFLELEALKSLGDLYLEKGKVNSDVSQFSKAAAMYNKALRRCEDPETKQTLQHRVLYMDKAWDEMRMKSSSSKNEPRLQERGPYAAHEIIPDHHLHSNMSSLYKDHLKEGESSLARADLDSAEQHFAAALKMVHEIDPTVHQCQREVEPLCKLGDVYSKRGQQTGDGGDFVKAAALYNAAIARSEDQVLNGIIVKAIREVEMSFLCCILAMDDVNQDNTGTHKKQLKEMRDQIKLAMETIDQQLDPYVLDEDDPCARDIEANRAKAVRHLFENIAQQRKEFISLLVEECIGLMGPPPCKYALIGLGSQATGLVTPYSDLEFAILVEEEREVCLLYFRNLTHYLHLKVVNLGETILPALGIKCLNDFYSENPLGNWYCDSVTPRGFAFDGSMPKSSKTPLGRQGTKNQPPSQLIHTPENMASILQRDVTLYLKEGYHLANILRNPRLIAGDQDLIDPYMAITREILQADGGKMAQHMVQEVLRDNMGWFDNEETITARLIDVKKELYRFPTVAVDGLALSSGIIPTTVWETIEEMENQQVISPNNAHHLTVLTSISAELRLRTYIANGGQNENLSALASDETTLYGHESPMATKGNYQLKSVFHLPNEKQLLRYYYTAMPLKHAFSQWQWTQKIPAGSSFSELCDNSPRMRGMIYYELGNYKLAISSIEEAMERAECTSTEKIGLLQSLGDSWYKLGNYQKAIKCQEQAILDVTSVYGQNTANLDTATSLHNLGQVWQRVGDQRKAINNYEQALEMYRSIYTLAHPVIATALSNLGSAWEDIGDYRKAVNYQEQALYMLRTIYGHGSQHPAIAASLNSLGEVWARLGHNEKAVEYYDQALRMFRRVYGETTVHPNIAASFNSLGSTWASLGDYRKSITYMEQALQMVRNIYGQTTAHPDIANSLNNVGTVYYELGDQGKAISYYQQALQMYVGVYGQSTAHPDIAMTLNNLGQVWGDHKQGINYLEQALQMYKSVYEQHTEHPDIARTLNNLGSAWSKIGDNRKAMSYHEVSLQMYKSFYGEDRAHPDISTTISDIGKVCSDLGVYEEAVRYHKQALTMQMKIYGQDTPHPDIANSLNNLGQSLGYLGDPKKGINYHERALQMYMHIYGPSAAHSDIANVLSHLGKAWGVLCDQKRAITYHEQALQMYRSIYGQSKAYNVIAETLTYLGLAWKQLGDHAKGDSICKEAAIMVSQIHSQDKS